MMKNNLTYQPKISKEEVNRLEVEEFAGKIIVVDTPRKIKQAIETLGKQAIVGIDTETKPSFKRGVVHKVSLIQVATEDECYLFRLNKIGFPEQLSVLFSNNKVTKVGLALRDDLNGLFKQSKFNPKGFVDLQNEVNDYGILELSLQKIYALMFGKKISKSQRLTNWENDELSEQQQIYAATDAWATLRIYLQLSQEKKLPKSKIKELISEFTTSNNQPCTSKF